MATDKIKETELKKMLTDVRKSYRFLYLFQQRILDLVKFIGRHYQFDYYGGWSHFSDAFRKGKNGKLENWAWDWLPMYHFDFVFTTPLKLKEDDDETLIFSVLLQCDTGFYDIENPSYEKKTQPHVFASPEDSRTFIHLVLRGSKRNIQDYKDTQVKSSSSEKFFAHTDEGLILGYKIPLEKLLDEQSTRNQLHEFTKYVYEKTKILLKELPSELENS